MIKSYVYRGYVSSCLSELNIYMDNLMDILSTIISDKDVIFEMRLIINELMINGVVHGNMNLRGKKVSLSLIIDDRRVKIIVEDEGSGVCCPTDTKSCSYCTHGRGLLIVNALADQLITDNNKVIVVKKYK